MYFGEFLNSKLLGKLNKGLLVLAILFGLAAAGLGVGAVLESSKVHSMKEEIASKSKAIVDAQEAQKEEKAKPVGDKLPMGTAMVGLFQTRLNKLVSDNSCTLSQFQASDQMAPFVSTFTATPSTGSFGQVDVKMVLLGPTRAVIQTLKDIDTLGIPYEFTSVEMSRTQVSTAGEATVSANVSLRVLVISGGA